jgi:hypothetical protein
MSEVQEFFRKIVGPTDEEFYRNARVMQLATYNSEVGRGLVHTPEWVAFMEKEQAWFNSQQT